MTMNSLHTKMEGWPVKTLGTDRISDQSRTDHYGDSVRRIAEDCARRAARMQTNALNVDVREFYLYARLHAGRRCSCFQGVSQEPRGDCPVCFGTGIVGGYEKFGTHAELIDCSRLCSCVNVLPDLGDPALPPMFRLEDDSVKGYITSDVEIGYNVGEIDYYRVFTHGLSNNSRMSVYVRSFYGTDSDYVKCTDKVLGRLLLGGCRRLRFRIDFFRNHLQVQSPRLSHLFLRYRNRSEEKCRIRADIPPVTNSALFDTNGGAVNNFSTISMVFDPSVYNNYTSDDFLYDIDRDLKWKLFEIEKKKSAGVFVQTQCQATLVNEFDNGIQSVPV